MHLVVYSLDKTLFEGEVEKLIAKTAMGEITVLDNHIPLVSILTNSPLSIVDKSSKKNTIDVGSGIIEIRPESQVVILAN